MSSHLSLTSFYVRPPSTRSLLHGPLQAWPKGIQFIDCHIVNVKVSVCNAQIDRVRLGVVGFEQLDNFLRNLKKMSFKA